MIQTTLRFSTCGNVSLIDAPLRRNEAFERIAARIYPDGYTLLKGRGYWWNFESEQADSEPSYALIATADISPEEARARAIRLSAWIRDSFSQVAVWAEFSEVIGELLTESTEV